ncbi:hypothetical protein Plec18170_000314 [Paecilomyces lecythidis]
MSTIPAHTYGPTCLLADKDEDPATIRSSPSPPRLRAQFFYASSLPIDDPLAPLPIPSGSSSSAYEKFPPQPFSARDNIALEKAWKELRDTRETKLSRSSRTHGNGPPKATKIPGRHHKLTSRLGTPTKVGSQDDKRTGADDTLRHSSREPESIPPSPAAGPIGVGGQHTNLKGDDATGDGSGSINDQRKRELSPLGGRHKSAKRKTTSSPSGEAHLEPESAILQGSFSSDMNISGSPFIRAPSRRPDLQSDSPMDPSSYGTTQSFRPSSARGVRAEEVIDPDTAVPRSSGSRRESTQIPESPDRLLDKLEDDVPQAVIPVGHSRLHLVELPNLKMKPIYWSPVHDISDVLRATWFYKNTMLPVEPQLANKLEEGYLYMQPWTETWQDELNSCVENGADAEMKIVHSLWPKEDSKPASRPMTAQEPGTTGPQPMLPDKSTDNEVEALTFDDNIAASGAPSQDAAMKPFKSSSVIYVDAKNAQVLRPSLLPSVSRGRRPLSAIRKGRQIGIPVIRGFSRQMWDKLYPSKPNPVDVRNYIRRPQSRDTPVGHGGQVCYACAIEESRPSPTDLMLVIHGIGQKLSERVESFHFTHAINAFRRHVNVELNSETVWPHIRPELGGIMVLPVNWRSTLSLEDANIESQANEDPTENHYSLNDITPDTIPAIRTLVSDVMLDIPYYLSHHKSKMIQAVVKEANRVYRLWCKNNPGFQDYGKVHVIAHSLGSVMSFDILSHQPTRVPYFDFDSVPVHNDIFEFDTSNLFICGSPAGLFLLLHKANLLPRRGRNKPGREGEDLQRGVAGEADKYGCLAVDNIYNIMHTTDPIAYRINAAVDSDLANSLRPAPVPSSSSSFFQSFASVFRWSSSTGPAPSTTLSATALPARPAAMAKLPSNVELETHDFTREEIAEKRMLLLNDNGQIDYYLSGGGGPLNIQYLNMLSAHSSYWTLTDFIRFVVVEVARKQGKDGTLPALKAVKKKGWKTQNR